MNVLVFEFLKRRPVKFSRDEEIEISLISSAGDNDVFIARVSQQSFQRIYLQIPLPVIKRSAFEPDMEITLSFTKDGLLGTSKARIVEILHDENPPLFGVQMSSDTVWEEIVPARLASPPAEKSAPSLALTAGDGEKEYACVAREVTGEGFLIGSPVSFEPHIVLTITVPLDEPLAFNAEVLSCLRRGESAIYEVLISLSEIDDEKCVALKEALKSR